MGLFGRRSLVAAVTASGLAMLSAPGGAQVSARGYTLLIEDGVDAISVRTLVAGRLGAPAAIGRIARDAQRNPGELHAIAARMEGGRTIVVACPKMAAALEAAARRSASHERRIAAELGRVLPASELELLVFS
jgi:hypothetical protein